MSDIQFTLHPDWIIRTWPRIEKYQNSTLMYTPPKDFPAYWAKANNTRLSIIRTWVALDEIWNIETDQYDWNFLTSVDKPGKKRHYPGDWADNRSHETKFEDYLTSYCAIADEAILNVRRFERETTDGILSYEKFEEVCERAIEHCRELCPNITYIEASNEVELACVAKLTMEEYIPLYNCVCRAVTRLNQKHGWTLKVGGSAMGNSVVRGLWHDYMRNLAEDDCPQKRIDFYSFHVYDTDTNRLNQAYNIHRSDLVKYNLPDVPVFLDEYGVRRQSPEPIESLMNASGTLQGLLRAADLENCYVFPWCTFHNPAYQMSYTQYIRLPEGGYAPTPNGLAVKMLCGMLRDEIIVEGDTGSRVRATAEGREMYVLLTNPDAEDISFRCRLEAPAGERIRVEISQVDEIHNNSVMNPPCMELSVTDTREIDPADGKADFALTLPRYGFASCRIVRE